jgi:hypothetical protein
MDLDLAKFMTTSGLCVTVNPLHVKYLASERPETGETTIHFSDGSAIMVTANQNRASKLLTDSLKD